MTTYVPFSLSHLLPAEGSIQLTSQDFASASGKIGPITVKLTNSSIDTTAVISYSNPYIPPAPPIEYPNVDYDQDGKVIHFLSITVVPGMIAYCDCSNGNSTNNWNVGDYFVINGLNIGGASPFNDLTFMVTSCNPESGGVALAATFVSGVVPGGPSVAPVLPSPSNPTQVIIVGPGQTEYVQIPGSIVAPDYVPLTLYASGADVYVTPVQIIA